MATTKPLDEQIVDILTKECTAAGAAAVRDLAEAALADANAEADAADVASLSPLATDAQAGQLRARSNDLRFMADRLEARVAALSTRVAELQSEERNVVARATHAAALAERDELAADIARDYPAIVRHMTDLVKRIAASDDRCARVGIRESAEAIARGVQANFVKGGGPLMRLRDIRLPLMDIDRLAWGFSYSGEPEYHGLALGAGFTVNIQPVTAEVPQDG